MQVNKRHQRKIVDDYWRALLVLNADSPRLFTMGRRHVTVASDDFGTPQIVQVGRAVLSDLVDRTCDSVRSTNDGVVPCHPDIRSIDVMLSTPHPDIPVLHGVVSTPVFVPPGDLVATPGFNDQSGLFLFPDKEFVLPRVSPKPSDGELATANQLLTESLMGDIPFVGEADRTNTVAGILTPFARQLISGPTPPFLIAAPSPATGKSLLATIMTLPAAGRPPAILHMARSDEEGSRRILAALRPGPTAVLIDNVTGTLDSGVLSSALTATSFSDRVVGSPDTLSVPIRNTWLITANNPSLSSELSRRMVPIWLDRKMERPWEFTGFKHPDLIGWATRNRPDLVWASLTIIQSAKNAGWPESSAVMGSYESWAARVGGIVEHAGFKEFLANRRGMYEAVVSGESEWKQFLIEWHQKWASELVDARTLCGLAAETGLLSHILAGRDTAKAVVSMGKELSNRADQRLGDLFIKRVRPDRSGAWLYQVVEVDGSG